MTTTLSDKTSSAALAGKYLTFRLGNESYGIPVLKVREIINLIPITIVPRMPNYIKGVINLRGRIIPVADLRTQFDMAETQTTGRTCIIVVQLTAVARVTISVGLIVDSVEEVNNIAAADIEEIPEFGAVIDTSYLFGMAKIKGMVVLLLDIDNVLSGEGLAGVIFFL